MSKPKASYEQKLESVLQYINGNISQVEGANKNAVSLNTFPNWIIKFKTEGAEGLKRSTKLRKHSKELKIQAVQEYLSGKGSLRTICSKYGIRDEKTLRDWIKWYNGHKVYRERSSGKGGIIKRKW